VQLLLKGVNAMADEMQQLKIRLPDDLKKQIEAVAGRNNRSLNSEVVRRLQSSLSTSEKLTTALTMNMYIAQLDEKIRQVLTDHGPMGAESFQKQRNQVSKLLQKVEMDMESELGELPFNRHRPTCDLEDHPIFKVPK